MPNEVQPIKSKKDFRKLKASLHGRDRLLLTLGTAFGLRVSDLLTLRIGDIRNKNEIHIRERKRGKSRVITLSKSVKSEVRDLQGDDNEYLFRSRKGGKNGGSQPITRTQAYRILNAGAERAGLADLKIGTHSLRKTFGYRLYENGVNITRIMAILNHSSEKETLRYIGVTADEIAEAYEAIEV